MTTIVKTRNGKFQASVRLKGHKPRYKTFNTRKAAREWSENLEDKLRANLPELSKPLEMNLSEALDRYVEDVGQWHKGYDVVDKYLVKRLKRDLGYLQIGSIDALKLSEYASNKLQKVTGSTVRRELGYIQRVFNYLRKDLQIEVAWPSIRMPQENAPRDRIPSQEELTAILEQLSPDIQDYVLLASETAMRRGEIARIQAEHVNSGNCTLFLPITKNGRPRTIPLTQKALSILERRFKEHSGLLFHVHPSSVSHAFNRACKALGIEGVCFHSLRHKRITELFEMGWTTEQVRVVSGHLDGRMLSRYSHLQASKLVSLLD